MLNRLEKLFIRSRVFKMFNLLKSPRDDNDVKIHFYLIVASLKTYLQDLWSEMAAFL